MARMDIVRRVRAGAFHMRVPCLFVVIVAALLCVACEREQPVVVRGRGSLNVVAVDAHAYAHRRQCRRTDRDCLARVDANACAYRNANT